MAADLIPFGATRAGAPVHLVPIESDRLSARILTLGAGLQDLRMKGVPHRLTLGFDHLGPYEGDLYHVGTIMGPVANRIAGARAVIDGVAHRFDRNFQGQHTLHGGSAATHATVWQVQAHQRDAANLTATLPDGAGGFPGNRRLSARFEIRDAALTLTLTAETDAPTLMNLANHSYWNLGPDETTAGHQLQIHAERYLPFDPETTLPLGAVAPVTGTRFDYRRARVVEAGQEGLLDVNFCLSEARAPLRPVARLTGPNGLAMEMDSTEPGLQVFDGHILGYQGLALEAQFWPNAPAHAHFPDITLRPGQHWQHVTRWSFSAPN